MRRFIIPLFLFVCSLFIVACDQNVSIETILNTSDCLYVDIRTIITDPAVWSSIPDEKKEELAKLESTYLLTISSLREADSIKGREALIVAADNVISLLETAGIIPEKYSTAITAVRISLNVLKNKIKACTTAQVASKIHKGIILVV